MVPKRDCNKVEIKAGDRKILRRLIGKEKTKGLQRCNTKCCNKAGSKPYCSYGRRMSLDRGTHGLGAER